MCVNGPQHRKVIESLLWLGDTDATARPSPARDIGLTALVKRRKRAADQPGRTADIYEIPIKFRSAPSRIHTRRMSRHARAHEDKKCNRRARRRRWRCLFEVGQCRATEFEHPCCRALRGSTMLDIVMLAIAAGFFVVSVGYAYACDRL
jgi:hypothetical protein